MGAPDNEAGEIFEGLWLLRASYPHRSDYDSRGILSVPEAIAYGELLLRRPIARDRWRGFGRQPHRAA
jgi:hypothetical protein